MRGNSLKIAELPPSGRRDITAALLWDVPTLQRSKSKGARMFMMAMNFHIMDAPQHPEGRDALIDAVCGLDKEFAGNNTEAREVYEQIVQGGYGTSVEPLTRLLGLALLAWSNPPNLPQAINRAEQALNNVKKPVLRAMYLAKLSVFASNGGERLLASQLLAKACEEVPENRPILKWRIHSEATRGMGINQFGQRPKGNDPLAEFGTIRLLAGGAASKALVEAAEEKAKSPWTRSLHFGMTSADSSIAAVMQAEWAGASWILEELRLQSASAVFLLGGRSSEEWVNASASWSIGGGSQLPRMLDYAERHFSKNSFNSFYHTILRQGDRLRGEDRLIEILLVFWDLLSAEDAIDILNRFEPIGGGWTIDNIRALWGVLAAIVPNEWAVKFLGLEPHDQIAMLRFIPDGAIAKLPINARELLVQRWFDLHGSSSDNPNDMSWSTAAALAFSEQRQEVRTRLVQILESAPALDRLQVAGMIPTIKDGLRLQQAIEEVWSAVLINAEKARSGTMAMGGVSLIQRLSTGLSHLDPSSATKPIVHGLVELAQDQKLFAELRSEALMALLRIGRIHGGDINGDSLRILANSNQAHLFDATETEFISDLGRLVAIVSADNSDSPADLFALCRNPDPRVRQLAVEAAGELLQTRDDRLLEGTILSSLFDPSHIVVRAGLQVVEHFANRIAWSRDPLINRARDLYESENRTIRIAVYRAADALEKSGTHDARISGILELAKIDRSFRVRQAVKN